MEDAFNNLIKILQQAAQHATPWPKSHTNKVNISLELKKLIIEKRRARKKWHTRYAPAEKTIYNRLCNKLKLKLEAIQDSSFQDYISNLSQYDNSTWCPVKAALKP